MSAVVDGYVLPASEVKRVKAARKKYAAKQLRKKAGKKKGKAGAGGKLPAIDGGKLNEDARSGTSEVPLVANDQQGGIVFEPPLSGFQLAGVCQAFVSYALQKGFMSGSDTLNTPYLAYLYMFDVLTAFVLGQVPAVTKLPWWMLCLGRALSPKNCKFQLGTATYRFALDTYTPTNGLQLGYIPYGYSWVMNYPDDGTPVNGFPTSAQPGSGTLQEMQSAFQNLNQYMSRADNVNNNMVSIDAKTQYDSNVSAFAAVASQEGLGINNCGGISFLAQLEVPIFCPLLGKFVRFIEGNPQNRQYNLSVMNAGDSTWLGAVMSFIEPPERWNAKRAPRFHPVDFLEFADVLAKWVSKIQLAAVNDEALLDTDPAMYTCPLSLQEMQLLLRYVLMQAFSLTQSGCQNIMPNFPANDGDVQFIGYASGSTTCALNALDVQLPMPMIENIRALVYRSFNVGRKKNKNDIQSYIPILGQYYLDQLSTLDYTYTTPSAVTFPSFTVPVFSKFVTDPKTSKRVETKLPEVAISLVDGNASGTFLFINDPGQLKNLAMLWNNWLKNTGVQNYCVQLGTFGTEQGIKSLCSVSMTRHWAIIPPGVKAKALDYVDERFAVRQRTFQTVYSARNVLADTSQGAILASPYEIVLSTWILPLNKVQVETDANNTQLQRWQATMGEPYYIPTTAGTTGVSLDSLHDLYASKMTKGKLATSDDWTEFFKTEAAKGRGGILSAIGGFFDGAFGV